MTQAEQELWNLVLDSNRRWLSGEPRALSRVYREDAVMATPGFAQRLRGRETLVQSYIEYNERAKTHGFVESEPAVDLFGDAAVVTYRFTVRYEIAGVVHDESGHEVLMFVRTDGRWQIAWRTQIPAPL